MKPTPKALLAAFLIACPLVGTSSQGDVTFDEKALAKRIRQLEVANYKGLDGIAVGICGVSLGEDDAKDPNVLTDEELDQLVKLKLRSSRITVFDFSDITDFSPTNAKYKAYSKAKKVYLDVSFTMLKTSDGLYVYSFRAVVREPSKSIRNPKLEHTGIVSERSSVGYAGQSRVREAMREQVAETMDDVCAMYLEANS